MHHKKIIIINGSGLKGKDTLILHISKTYPLINISSIDKIKEVAKILGWDGEKDEKGRRLLSELKLSSIAYNDLPLKYTLDECEKFAKDTNRILFIHIREPEEIRKTVEVIKEKYGITPVTLKVDNSSEKTIYGNSADDNVDNYNYDYTFMNDYTEEKAKIKFLEMIEYEIVTDTIVPFMDFNTINNPVQKGPL